MAVSSHLNQLREKHEALKVRIREEERRPGIDHLEVVQLKREKLQLKEEIHRLQTVAG
ncbi:MAG: YdcH family protein [Pseudomonadota bacterium]